MSEKDGYNSTGLTVPKKPPIPAPAVTLGALIDWLKSEDVPGLIIGGIAASLLGRPRFTQDVDVLILLQEDLWQSFLTAGVQFGFSSRINDAAAFARRSRVFLVRHEPTGVDVDIALAGLPFEEESIEQARMLKIGKVSVPLPTPENLIIMKAVARRPSPTRPCRHRISGGCQP